MGFLDKVSKGKFVEPVLVLAYGVDGIGKSKFASEAPEPLFLGAEQGTAQLDVSRSPAMNSFKDVMELIREMIAAESLPYKSLVVDSLDWFEPLIWKHVCATHPKNPKAIEDIGYQKGYSAAITFAREFMGLLTNLRNKHKIHIILLAHAKIRTFQDPANSPYDRYQLSLRDDLASVFCQWVDGVLFMNYDVFKQDEEDRRAYGEGTRTMYTEERPSFKAKNRYGLDFKIPMVKGQSWKAFYSQVERGQQPDTPASLTIEIENLYKAIPTAYVAANPGVQDKIRSVIKEAGADITKLRDIRDRLKAINGGAL